MRTAQVILYESDGRLAALLKPSAQTDRWLLREVRQLDACRKLLGAGPGAVLVLKLGRDLEAELALVAELALLAPDVALVVVGDVDNPTLAGLAWDLGASYVLFPPLPRELLVEVVNGFLASSLKGA